VKQIDTSPILNAPLKPFLSCKDHTVSQDEFSLVIDVASGLLITSPRPEDKDLGSYYESEAYISHTDSNQTVLDRVYQTVKNYAIKKKLKLINTFDFKEKTLLDIGVGTGDFISICEKNNWNVVGVEPNQKARNTAEKKLQKEKTKVYRSVESLLNGTETKPQTFDVITMWHVLEHVPNLNEYVSNLKQLLKPKGTLIIAVPNYKSYDAEYYKEFWAAYDVPRHLWHFSKTAIQKLFQQEQMKVIQIRPMLFDSFYVSLLSEKYKTGKSNLLKAFYIGFQSNIKARRTKEYSSHIYIIKND